MFGKADDDTGTQQEVNAATQPGQDWQPATSTTTADSGAADSGWTPATSTEDSAQPAMQPVTNNTEPEVNLPTPVVTTATPQSTPAATAPSGGEVDLVALKQQALQELSPLVDQLDQTPEEKFRTIMMMIQATDNKTLLTEAYEAAGMITDEKIKAQALLDVVNEINYFTQNQ